MFIQKAVTIYKIIGLPKVRNEMYINHTRMRLDEIPIFSPIAAHTPKRRHSIKYLSL